MYDKDGNGNLNAGELGPLLKDFSGEEVDEPDIHFIMRAADKNQDEAIGVDELLYCLKVWFALKRMPASVADCLRKHMPLKQGAMPTIREMQKLLCDLNDFKPVRIAEAAFVRQTALLTTDATETVTTRRQVRRAIAAWYLHVQRDDTHDASLVYHTVQDLHNELSVYAQSFQDTVLSTVASLSAERRFSYTHPEEMRQLQQPPPPEPAADVNENLLFAVGLCVSVVGCCFGLGMILVSLGYSPQCEHDLSSLLYWKGVMTLVLAVFVLAWLHWKDRELDFVSTRCVGSVFAALGVAFGLQGVYGMLVVSMSSAHMCGTMLFSVSWWMFIGTPFILFPLLLFGAALLLAARRLSDIYLIDQRLGGA